MCDSPVFLYSMRRERVRTYRELIPWRFESSRPHPKSSVLHGAFPCADGIWDHVPTPPSLPGLTETPRFGQLRPIFAASVSEQIEAKELTGVVARCGRITLRRGQHGGKRLGPLKVTRCEAKRKRCWEPKMKAVIFYRDGSPRRWRIRAREDRKIGATERLFTAMAPLHFSVALIFLSTQIHERVLA